MIPNDTKLEATLLGTFLVEPFAYTDHATLMFDDLWYSDIHRELYCAIKRLANKNKPFDITTVSNELKSVGKFDYVGGYEFMGTITNGALMTSQVDYHIRILVEYAVKRSLIAEGQNIITKASTPTQDVFELLSGIDNNLSIINSKIVGDDFEASFSDSIERTYKHLLTPREERHTGIKTDNPYLTNILGGWNEGFIILAARPSMGKTSRAVQIAVECALQNKQVAIFSLEMSQEHDINTKLLNYLSGIDGDTIKTQSWFADDLKTFENAKNRLKNLPLYVNDKSAVTPNYIRSVCRQRKNKYGLDMVIIDYLGLMEANEARLSTNDKIGSITKALKSISKDLSVPVICLSQLSRQCEERPNKRPQMRDLRDSGNIEQDADIIISLYRPSYYSEDASEIEHQKLPNEAYMQLCELGILKNRMGHANDRVFEYFDKNKGKFNYKWTS